MNTGLEFLLDLLYHRIILNDTHVPILKRPYPIDKTPCLTFDEQDTRLVEKYFTYEPLEYLNKVFDTSIVLNIWCDSEKDRQSILEQVKLCFNWLDTDNYQLCTEYDEGVCKYLNKDCPVPSSEHGRCMKHQCPHPEEYHYQNLFTKHHVYRNTLNTSEGVDNDEYERKPPLLRTMITINFRYLNKYCNDGKISTTLTYKEE